MFEQEIRCYERNILQKKIYRNKIKRGTHHFKKQNRKRWSSISNIWTAIRINATHLNASLFTFLAWKKINYIQVREMISELRRAFYVWIE